MTLTEAQRSELERLRKKYRIQFEQFAPQTRLPVEQQQIFKNIRELAKISYDDYPSEADASCSEKPWRLEAKNLALRVSEAAWRCRRRTEPTWRYTCEPLVFARVNADVACSRCRKRLWRSEVEASRYDDGRLAAQLKRRQGKRQSCLCAKSFRLIDFDEANGMSKIFGHREEEEICHPDALQRELPKYEKPDRVYGLRETRNFDDILHSPAHLDETGDRPGKKDTLVTDLLDVSLHSMDGDRLLFPFLVLEAKSGKAADDWHSIKLQSCFPIRSALEIQQKLHLTNETRSRCGNAPLVWFLMSRGEDWRVCFAFIEEDRTSSPDAFTTTYRIIDLWNGCVLTQDGALQLILIVDYIFDWARDIYRPTILTNLKALAGGTCDLTSSQLDRDSDIFSTKETFSKGNEVEQPIAPPIQATYSGSNPNLLRKSLCLWDANLTMRTDDPILNKIKELITLRELPQLLGCSAARLQEITQGFLNKIKTSSPTQDLTQDFEEFQDNLDFWKLAHKLPTITNQKFERDRKIALEGNEATLQCTIVISLIDRWRLNKMFTYNCKGRWLSSRQDLLPASEKTRAKLGMVNPDLVVFYDFEVFAGREFDSRMAIPEPLEICAFPDGNRRRCFPFLFIEARKGRYDLDHALYCNMHSASQALWNMYKWMVAGDQVCTFFDHVRVFTVTLNAEKLIVRIHRAERIPGEGEWVLKYLYDDLYISYDYLGADTSLLIRNLLLEYGVARLRGHLIAAYEIIIGMQLPTLRDIPGLWDSPGVRDAVERMEAFQAQSAFDAESEEVAAQPASMAPLRLGSYKRGPSEELSRSGSKRIRVEDFETTGLNV